MKKLKQVAKTLKNQKLWREYKRCFHHKQLRFTFSKVVLAYQKDTDVNLLLRWEKRFLEMPKTPKAFATLFANINQILQNDWKWEAFGNFMYFIYQTSLYHQSKGNKGVLSVFNESNYVELNATKREYFHTWLESIPLNLEGYNKKLIKVMECVF